VELVRLLVVEHRLSQEISCHSNIPAVLLPATMVVLMHTSCCGIESNVDKSEAVVTYYNILSVNTSMISIIGKKTYLWASSTTTIAAKTVAGSADVGGTRGI
jgi:uncharacterized membrane protein